MSEHAAESDAAFRCLRCGSDRFVSISLDGGYTRRPQCVPCGRIDSRYFGHGSRSNKWDTGWTRVNPPGSGEAPDHP